MRVNHKQLWLTKNIPVHDSQAVEVQGRGCHTHGQARGSDGRVHMGHSGPLWLHGALAAWDTAQPAARPFALQSEIPDARKVSVSEKNKPIEGDGGNEVNDHKRNIKKKMLF